MTIFYKATRPNGTDFYTRTVDYAGALTSSETLTHPAAALDPDRASTYYSVSTEPAETLIGGVWPCRLFEVEAIGEAQTAPTYPHKRCVVSLRVIREIEAWRALGPNGREVVAFVESIPAVLRDPTAAWSAASSAALDAARAAARDAARDAAWSAASSAAWSAALDAASSATRDAASSATRAAALDAARDAAWSAALDAARDAALDAAWSAAWSAASSAASSAALALVVRDLIRPEDFEVLTRPWQLLTGEEL